MTNLDRQIEAALAFDPVNSSEQEVNACKLRLPKSNKHTSTTSCFATMPFCLNDIQQGERNAVLNSSEYRVCQILRDCTHIEPCGCSHLGCLTSPVCVCRSRLSIRIFRIFRILSVVSIRFQALPRRRLLPNCVRTRNIYRSWHQDIIDFLNSQHTQDTLKIA